MVLLIAGMETTAQTLTALTYHLLTNPVSFQRRRNWTTCHTLLCVACLLILQPEAKRVQNAIIQEGIRLYPGVATLKTAWLPIKTYLQESLRQDSYYTRRSELTKFTAYLDTNLPTVPVGMTGPLLSPLESLYPSPRSFLPERYLDNPSLPRYQLAFSKDSLQCIGINLAYTELQCIIASIFRRYDVYVSSRKHQIGPALELFETSREDVILLTILSLWQ
jgi:cytochrome P450